MTTAIPERRADIAQDPTEAHEPAGVLGHSARRGSLAFERPAPGRYLAIEDGHITRLVPLRAAITHLGRGFSAGVRLEDQSVSRRHAVIVERSDGLHILDDRSANGTFVNDVRVVEAPLRDRDIIQLGRVTLVYVDVAG
jgi:pSer/pThr/pTyr-binding forkhead associated (FHA) protein